MAKTPRPDPVAERLALRGTNDRVATDARYARIAADLAAIRTHGELLVSKTVFARFATGTVLLTMEPDVRTAISAGKYRGLDCQNEWYGATFAAVLNSTKAVTFRIRAHFPMSVRVPPKALSM